MKKSDLINSILNEANDLTPPDMTEELKSYPITVIPVEIRPVKKKPARLLQTFILFLVLFFGMGTFYSIIIKEETVVSIDINPSIEFTLNRYDRVVGVKAYNERGEDFLSKLNVTYCTLDEAILKTLILANTMGFLSDDKMHDVLFSVKSLSECKEYEYLNRISEKFRRDFGNITLRNVEPTATDEMYSKIYKISPAKIAFIRSIYEKKYGRPMPMDDMPNDMIDSSVTDLVREYAPA